MRIAVLTAIPEFKPSYSLSHVIQDQLIMLIRGGHEPVLVTRANGHKLDVRLPLSGGYSCEVWPIIPKEALNKRNTEPTAHVLLELLVGCDAVFTHDWIHLERFKPYADLMLSIADETRSLPWFHWVHSVPTSRRHWWDLGQYGANHYLVYLNATDLMDAAKQFKAPVERCLCIPPAVDMRTEFAYETAVWRILDAVPGLTTAQFTQVYPAAADRLKDKGIDKLVKLFGALKAEGQTVCCLVADSWSGVGVKADKGKYRRIAEGAGLTEHDFAFMSDITVNFEGLPRHQVAQLQQWSSLFAYPTIGEAFGLILPEAILASGPYVVSNGSLPMLREVVGDEDDDEEPTYWAEFGSCEQRAKYGNEAEFYRGLAREIVKAFGKDRGLRRRNRTRINRTLAATFSRYYEPLLRGVSDGRMVGNALRGANREGGEDIYTDESQALPELLPEAGRRPRETRSDCAHQREGGGRG
ncbi:MAG: glycosyltransferase [Patescibacteria group bacterium]